MSAMTCADKMIPVLDGSGEKHKPKETFARLSVLNHRIRVGFQEHQAIPQGTI